MGSEIEKKYDDELRKCTISVSQYTPKQLELFGRFKSTRRATIAFEKAAMNLMKSILKDHHLNLFNLETATNSSGVVFDNCSAFNDLFLYNGTLSQEFILSSTEKHCFEIFDVEISLFTPKDGYDLLVKRGCGYIGPDELGMTGYPLEIQENGQLKGWSLVYKTKQKPSFKDVLMKGIA